MRAQSLVEYAYLFFFIVLVVLLVAAALGYETAGTFSTVTNAI